VLGSAGRDGAGGLNGADPFSRRFKSDIVTP
jgi:hypothetical protein